MTHVPPYLSWLSDEPLATIERECCTPLQLPATRRFRRLFNEIAALKADREDLVKALEAMCDANEDPLGLGVPRGIHDPARVLLARIRGEQGECCEDIAGNCPTAER